MNMSVQNCSVPDRWKAATVTPLPKKSTLDPEEKKNYRPVSNLSYISKLAEKAVLTQLNKHFNDSNLLHYSQTAYRQNYSTETALVKIQNDMFLSMDKKKFVLLVLLDMSAAFDTVKRSTLLGRLENRFGVSGEVNKWFASYFSDRVQSVSI